MGGWLWAKFRQLIIPAIVFGGVYAASKGISAEYVINDQWKVGYWFTITLFEFALLIFLIDTAASRLHIRLESAAYALILCGVGLLLLFLSIGEVRSHFSCWGVIQMPMFRYFVPYAVGRLVGVHLQSLIRWRWKHWAVAAVVLLFFVFAVDDYAGVGFGPGSGALFHLRVLLFGAVAVLVVFLLFYRNRAFFERGGRVTQALCFVGRRTLDVYMLHYFFLPSDLTLFGSYFAEHPATVAELFVGGIATLLVVGMALLTGAAIRTSDILAHWLLGAK